MFQHKRQDLSETADITIQAVNEETFEVWEKQPLLLDMKGYDDVEGQDPPPRFTINKAKKYLKELGADPDKLELSEYGTVSYNDKRIGAIDMRSPRSEQLRREIVRGISWGDIPVKEMKRKVSLNKREKALLNSLGDLKPSAKELDNYL
ncbi:MAG: hypothetical protein GPJ51_12015, partial [Candidatus Heimdallarchaeota archaeon]|nr:hypothetical protein [Candidatus Heimdallarchaeota archaeon]